MAEIRVNGVSLYYETRGAGPGVVLVHGSWTDADSWVRVLPGLAEETTVVSYDRRGHSRSEDLLTQGSVYEDAADLAGLIVGLGLAPAYVCGDSYGGLIALRLAAARPDLLRGVTVHEPPATGILLADPELRPSALPSPNGSPRSANSSNRPNQRPRPSSTPTPSPSARAPGNNSPPPSATPASATPRPTSTNSATRTPSTSTSPPSTASPNGSSSPRATTAPPCTAKSST